MYGTFACGSRASRTNASRPMPATPARADQFRNRSRTALRVPGVCRERQVKAPPTRAVHSSARCRAPSAASFASIFRATRVTAVAAGAPVFRKRNASKALAVVRPTSSRSRASRRGTAKPVFHRRAWSAPRSLVPSIARWLVARTRLFTDLRPDTSPAAFRRRTLRTSSGWIRCLPPGEQRRTSPGEPVTAWLGTRLSGPYLWQFTASVSSRSPGWAISIATAISTPSSITRSSLLRAPAIRRCGSTSNDRLRRSG
jgi:hypothetical protein